MTIRVNFNLSIIIENQEKHHFFNSHGNAMGGERVLKVVKMVRKNIYKISYNHINNIERPLYLSRSKKSGTLHDVP